MKRVCSICKKEKVIEDFGKNRCAAGGFDYRCKVCHKEYNRNRAKIDRKRYYNILPVKVKACSICKQEKKAEEFSPRKGRKDGLACYCNDCLNERKRTLWCSDKEYKEKRLTEHKNYKQSHKKQLALYRKTYNKENYQKIKNSRNKYLRHKKVTNPAFKTLCNLRSRILLAIKLQYGKKAYRTIELLGCTVSELMKHLESQFDNRMTWQNHTRKGWHIDHIVPCACFDLTDPVEQKQCFHYTNLRPMWSFDNGSKNSTCNGKRYYVLKK